MNGMNRRELFKSTGGIALFAPQTGAQTSTLETNPVETTAGVSRGLALYPRVGPSRHVVELGGFWDFRHDLEPGSRDSAGGFQGGRPIAVPASWNDQFHDLRDFLGPAWYQTRFDLPPGFDRDQHLYIRFGSVNYLAEVWLNGQPLGKHEGGHLPFQFEITGNTRREDNLLVVRVDGKLAPDRVPPMSVNPDKSKENYPPTSFDFFPFAGIHRPVLLYSTPPEAIADLTVRTSVSGGDGIVQIHAEVAGSGAVRFRIEGHGERVESEAPVRDGAATTELRIRNAALWAPGAPNLYQLTTELTRSGQVVDRYRMSAGVRTVAVDGDALLLNGRPIFLRGFGRHEDFPVVGRGLVPAVIIKDYAMMQWLGANSFRTSHYPYSEQMMDMADRLGFLVIDEIPAVGLFFAEEGLERRLALCRQYVSELIARDKNHPSAILWSLANEPHTKGMAAAPRFFRTLYDLAKSLDQTRPVTLVSDVGLEEASFEFLDLMCLNRYMGWYADPGRIQDGVKKLSEELDQLHARYNKPVIMSEFGADAVDGWHAQPPEMFSEEYQSEMIARYHDLFRTKPYVVGEHIWNLCDFKTSQAVRRVGAMNLKGVLTRDRRPKMAAHQLRQRWLG